MTSLRPLHLLVPGLLTLVACNHDPVVSLTLAPSEGATRIDTLTCSAEPSDEDGDELTTTLSWTVAGASVDASASSDETSTLEGVFAAGDEVACRAQVEDGQGGSDNATISTTIVNTAPTVGEVSLAPEPAYTNDTLTATATASDEDEDELSLNFDWYVAGELVQSGADHTLDGATWFAKDQEAYVTVTADDGETATDGTSSTITIANTPPEAPVVSIDPSDAVEADDLVCELRTESEDADGDSITYSMAWTVDGVTYEASSEWSGPRSTTWPDDTADGADTLTDEVWVCTATPNDGDEDGNTATDSVRVDKRVCETGAVFSSYTLAGGRETQGYRVFDIDEDGHDDLVFNNQLDQNIDFYFGDGSGTYSDYDDYKVGRSGGGFDFGDVDNDGHLDLVISNQDYSRIGVLPGKGNGTFGTTEFFSQEGFPQYIALIDADNDGNLDIVVRLSSCTALRLGDGAGGFASEECITTNRGAIGGIDIEGDGHGELVQRTDSTTVVVYSFDGDGAISDTTTLDTSACASVGSASVYDLDDDGNDDLLIPCTKSNGDMGLLFMESDGAGGFTACEHADELDGSGAFGDFNDDGIVDYILSTTCSYCDSTHTVYVAE